jgi:hypothetical protein
MMSGKAFNDPPGCSEGIVFLASEIVHTPC